jgi:hypothetical protein
MAPITEATYHARGGAASALPGTAVVAKGGRSDIHVWIDSAGELYIMSKSDGMIREVVAAQLSDAH